MSSNSIRICNKCKIYNDDYVIKPKKKDINYLYEYLKGNDFYDFPELIDEYEHTYKYRYINSRETPTTTDTLVSLAKLHNKTKQTKISSIDKINEIKDNINDNIIDIEYFYENLFNNIENDEYHSPSNYLLIRNASIILFMIKYSKDKLNEWYDKVKDKKNIDVSVIHGNPSIDHTIIDDKTYLISFDNYSIDSPILDIYKLYKNENNDLNVINNLNKYLEINELDKDDLDLLYLMISIPYKVDLNNSEIINTRNARIFIDLIYGIRNYIFKDKNS